MAQISEPVFLSEEEELELVNQTNTLVESGFPIRKKHLKDEIQRLLISKNRPNNFINSRPSEKSLHIFYNKYPELEISLEEIIKIYLKDVNVEEWFENLKSLLLRMNVEFKIVSTSNRIWTLDLMEFKFDEETKSYLIDVTSTSGIITTLCTTFCANGEIGPKMLIYDKNEKFYQQFIENFPSNWMLRMSDNGQFNEEIFKGYIDVLYKHLTDNNIELPILLLVNAQRVQISIELGKYCLQKHIILYATYLQSINSRLPTVGDLMYLVRQIWDSIVFPRLDTDNEVKKPDFLTLIQNVFEKLNQEAIKNTYKNNGIYPWRPSFRKQAEEKLKKQKPKLNKRGLPLRQAVLTRPSMPKTLLKRNCKKKTIPLEYLPVQIAGEKIEQFDSDDITSVTQQKDAEYASTSSRQIVPKPSSTTLRHIEPKPVSTPRPIFPKPTATLQQIYPIPISTLQQRYTEVSSTSHQRYAEHSLMSREGTSSMDINEVREVQDEDVMEIQPISLVKVEICEPEEVPEDVPDVLTLCRVCAGGHGVMTNIFSEEGQASQLQHKILKFLNINVSQSDSELPCQVCHFCVSALHVCQSLANTAADADTKLRAMVAARQSAINFVEPPVNACVTPPLPDITQRINQLISNNAATVQGAQLVCVPQLILMAQPQLNTDDSLSQASTSKKMKARICRQTPAIKKRFQTPHRKYYTKEMDNNSHLTCSLCQEVFPEMHNICAHYKLKHELYYCRYCYINLKSLAELRKHEKVHFMTCKFCGLLVRSGRDFRAHVRDKHKKELPSYMHVKVESFRVQCKLCDMITATTLTAKTHYFWDHQKEMCEFCFELFETKLEFEDHISQIHQIPCIYCPELFYTYLRYKRHLNKCHKQQSATISKPAMGQLTCTICSKNVKSKIYMKRHNFWGHAKYTCLICLQTFATQELEERHFETHGNSCVECGGKFETSNVLSEHYNTVHPDIKPYICEYCGIGFDTNIALNIHRPSHEPNKEHLCDQCGKEFKTVTLLGQHKYTHSKEKNKVVCPYCERKFTFQSQLKFHLRVHTDEKLFKCLDCNLKLSNSQSLRLHMKSHEITHQCEICPMSFESKANLKSHVTAIHEKSVIYKCKECRKVYVSQRDVEIHLKCHSNVAENYYDVIAGLYCDCCDAVFSTKSYLKSHIVKNHCK